MRRTYIKPSIELVNVEVESLLAGLSGTASGTWDGKDITEDTNLDIDNENGDGDDIMCAKPDMPNIWGDGEW